MRTAGARAAVRWRKSQKRCAALGRCSALRCGPRETAAFALAAAVPRGSARQPAFADGSGARNVRDAQQFRRGTRPFAALAPRRCCGPAAIQPRPPRLRRTRAWCSCAELLREVHARHLRPQRLERLLRDVKSPDKKFQSDFKPQATPQFPVSTCYTPQIPVSTCCTSPKH